MVYLSHDLSLQEHSYDIFDPLSFGNYKVMLALFLTILHNLRISVLKNCAILLNVL
jgi:hypothetical protein